MDRTLLIDSPAEVVYPESDGKPMADNTVQWNWMVMIVGELRDHFAGQDVFVAGDLLWYPVENQPRINAAPDAMVAFGRPAGDRGSYRQWHEGGIAPQVVFEVVSPSNTDDELDAKLGFYERYGVEEYYLIDPDEPAVEAYVRSGKRLIRVRRLTDFTSVRLGIRFEKRDGDLRILNAQGRQFRPREDVTAENRQLERERNRMAQKLRELGVDPDSL